MTWLWIGLAAWVFGPALLWCGTIDTIKLYRRSK